MDLQELIKRNGAKPYEASYKEMYETAKSALERIVDIPHGEFAAEEAEATLKELTLNENGYKIDP